MSMESIRRGWCEPALERSGSPRSIGRRCSPRLPTARCSAGLSPRAWPWPMPAPRWSIRCRRSIRSAATTAASRPWPSRPTRRGSSPSCRARSTAPTLPWLGNAETCGSSRSILPAGSRLGSMSIGSAIPSRRAIARERRLRTTANSARWQPWGQRRSSCWSRPMVAWRGCTSPTLPWPPTPWPAPSPATNRRPRCFAISTKLTSPRCPRRFWPTLLPSSTTCAAAPRIAAVVTAARRKAARSSSKGSPWPTSSTSFW